jgi:hypothetical protein
MSLLDDMAQDFKTILEDCGVQADYLPIGATEPIGIYITPPVYQTEFHRNMNVRSVHFSLSPLDIANPVDGDLVTIGSDTWTIRIDGDMFQLVGNGASWKVKGTRAEARRY